MCWHWFLKVDGKVWYRYLVTYFNFVRDKYFTISLDTVHHMCINITVGTFVYYPVSWIICLHQGVVNLQWMNQECTKCKCTCMYEHTHTCTYSLTTVMPATPRFTSYNCSKVDDFLMFISRLDGFTAVPSFTSLLSRCTVTLRHWQVSSAISYQNTT